MSKENEDSLMRISLERIANDDGDWLDAPEDDKTILTTAIFESLFSYVVMSTDESIFDMQLDITPEKIINAMLKRTELDVLDALLQSYEKRFTPSE